MQEKQEECEILYLFSFLFRIFADNIQILLAYDQETTSITISCFIFPTWEHFIPNVGM